MLQKLIAAETYAAFHTRASHFLVRMCIGIQEPDRGGPGNLSLQKLTLQKLITTENALVSGASGAKAYQLHKLISYRRLKTTLWDSVTETGAGKYIIDFRIIFCSKIL